MTEPFELAREIYRPEDLGATIRALRRQRGWSQAELADWLEVSRPSVIKLERGSGSIALGLRALLLLGAVPTVRLKSAGHEETRI